MMDSHVQSGYVTQEQADLMNKQMDQMMPIGQANPMMNGGQTNPVMPTGSQGPPLMPGIIKLTAVRHLERPGNSPGLSLQLTRASSISHVDVSAVVPSEELAAVLEHAQRNRQRDDC